MSDESNLSDLLTGARRHANAWVGAADAATGGMISSSLGLMPWSSMAEEKRKAAEAQDDFRQLYGRAGRDALAATQNPTNPARAFAHAGSTLADILQHAMFLGPLAPLDKIRKSGEWGHPSRVEAAQAALKEGRPADEVWREHGWLPVKDILRSGSNEGMATMVDPRGLAVRDWQDRGARLKANGPYLETYVSHPEMEGMFPEFFDKSIPLKIDIGSAIPMPSGATIFGGAGSKDFYNAFSGRGKPIRGDNGHTGMVGIAFRAPSERLLASGLAHEMDHLAKVKDPSGLPGGSSTRMAPYVWDSPASQEALAKAAQAKAIADELEAAGKYASPAPLREAARKAHREATFTGYTRDEGEQLARLSAIYRYYGLDPRKLSPTGVSAFGPHASGAHGADTSDYFSMYRRLKEGEPQLSPSAVLGEYFLNVD